MRIPTRTEAEHTLPDGTKVWIKTLNGTYKELASQEATLTAIEASAPVRKGGRAFSALQVEVNALSSEEVIDQITDAVDLHGRFLNEVAEALPDLTPPQQEAKEDEAAFLERMDKYNKDVEKLAAKRDKKYKELVDRFKAELAVLSRKELVQKWLDQQINERYLAAYRHATNAWYIYYATRAIEDHTEFHFGKDREKGFAVVMDLDDDVKLDIISKYNELDAKTSEIPT